MLISSASPFSLVEMVSTILPSLSFSSIMPNFLYLVPILWGMPVVSPFLSENVSISGKVAWQSALKQEWYEWTECAIHALHCMHKSNFTDSIVYLVHSLEFQHYCTQYYKGIEVLKDVKVLSIYLIAEVPQKHIFCVVHFLWLCTPDQLFFTCTFSFKARCRCNDSKWSKWRWNNLGVYIYYTGHLPTIWVIHITHKQCKIQIYPSQYSGTLL